MRATTSRAEWPRRLLPGLIACGAIVAASSVNGGYFPVSWGWISLGLLLAAGAALLLVEPVELGKAELVLLGALSLLIGWTALSTVWSESLPRTVLELERDLVYLAGVSALVVLAPVRSFRLLLTGVLIGTTAISAYGLATKLFPDRLGYDDAARLARPVGYWNGLGLLAVVGTLLALGFAASGGGRELSKRAAAAASLVVLLPTLYLTFSRGAWIALGVGLVALIALDPHRVRSVTAAVVLSPMVAVATWLTSAAHGVAGTGGTAGAAARDGHRLALELLALALVAALVTVGLDLAARRVSVGPTVRRAGSGALLVALVAVVVVGLVHVGGPQRLVEKGYDSFRAPLPQQGNAVEGRLFNFSGNGRADYWRIAWREYRSHPLLGGGAGTYEIQWARDRPTAIGALDAHNLYLETLAELGPIGLLLLITALGAPLPALRAVRLEPLGAAAGGAYVAFLLHAAIDWDWEMPAVTLAALFCGGGLLIATRSHPAELSGRPRRGALAVVVALAAFAFVGYVGNSALDAGDRAASAGKYARAAADARRASNWGPWSSEAWQSLGEAQLAQGRTNEAQGSFRTAIGMDPHDWHLWYNLALASHGAARRAALSEAARLNPLSPELAAVPTG